MIFSEAGSAATAASVPWFRRRPRVTVLTAVALFALVFALRLAVGTPSDAINMLYGLPIALVALAFGLRAGLAAGAVGVALVAAWAQIESVDLSAIGWASRVLPLLLLGGLLGDASDRLQRAADERQALEVSALRHREAIEINDTLVQGMAAAKWSLEAGRIEPGLATLTETIELAHKLVSNLMRQADMGIGAATAPSPRTGDQPGPEPAHQR